MAGSLLHLMSEKGGWSSAGENLGDTYETVEELLFLVLSLTSETERKGALEYFYQCKRGETYPMAVYDPDTTMAEQVNMAVANHLAEAYNETRKRMSR